MKHIKNVCRKNELFKTWFIGWLLLKTWILWNFKILQVIQRNLIKIRNKLCNRQLKNIFLLYLKLLEAKLYLDHLVVRVLLGLVANHLKCIHWESCFTSHRCMTVRQYIQSQLSGYSTGMVGHWVRVPTETWFFTTCCIL